MSLWLCYFITHLKVNYFWKKAPPQTFDWVLNRALGNTVKKQLFQRHLPSYVKLSVSLFLSCIFHFATQIKKNNMLQKEKKIELLKNLLYYLGNPASSRILLTELLQMTWARSYAHFLNFWSDKEGLDCFLWPNILPKLSKKALTNPKQ